MNQRERELANVNNMRIWRMFSWSPQARIGMMRYVLLGRCSKETAEDA